ncbi:MAG TPA: amino acid--tRNA ligase-related protein, partial [Clostridia bacterium]|nr:amino acid--tRNA ligase-related protein [Clostridia bacterium]
DGLTVAATDLLVPGIGEIIGCSEREADLEKLTKAMLDRKMNMEDYKGYMELRKFGSVPHSGFGLGLERILMYASGITNIRDVVLYSRTTGDLMV